MDFGKNKRGIGKCYSFCFIFYLKGERGEWGLDKGIFNMEDMGELMTMTYGCIWQVIEGHKIGGFHSQDMEDIDLPKLQLSVERVK